MPWHWSAMKDAKSCDKPRIAVLSDHPWISEWGNLRRATAVGQSILSAARPAEIWPANTRGSETSQYPMEQKTKVIPLVAASECGTAQTADFSAGL